MKRVVVMIDGGYVRACARKASKAYNPTYIEKIAHASVEATEDPLRFLYYDCPPFKGDVKLPISGSVTSFNSSDTWLKDLAVLDLFAVRLGELKIRGFERKNPTRVVPTLTDNDFKPVFEQKGVDMRIGLDIATYSYGKLVDKIVLMTADSDCIPAMKHARKAGIQVVLIEFSNSNLVTHLRSHADFVRKVAWP